MKNLAFFAGYFIGCIVILTSFLSALPIQQWWARICDFVPLQLIVMSVVSFLLFFIGRHAELRVIDWVFLTSLSCALIYHVISVYPYTKLHSYRCMPAENNNEGAQLSMVYCNVLMENRNSDLLLKVVTEKDPDLLLFAETDHWWQNKLEVLKINYPYYRELPLTNTYGMLFYSKLPFESKGFEFLVENDVPSLLPVIELKNGKKVQCYFIHPKPPVPGESNDSRERDAELILVAKMARASKLPVIVAGDLNDVGWSPSSILFQKNSQLLDPRIGRGLFATFNAKYPLFRWPLDHVFLSSEFRVASIEKLGYTGSDHFPIYLKVSYEPDGKYKQDPPELKEQDVKDANEKLQPDK